ncbi:MAG: hypothetical protein LBJ68_00455 [Endomicrobium sp.]|jgi:hypothetical protein|nr:hypothetical protein [Endomicrobium sp.]
MTPSKMYLDSETSILHLEKYDIVRLALKWIEIIKYEEDYKKLTQAELINKALIDIERNVATYEKIEEIQREKNKSEALK